jgi:hypothetical protein
MLSSLQEQEKTRVTEITQDLSQGGVSMDEAKSNMRRTFNDNVGKLEFFAAEYL